MINSEQFNGLDNEKAKDEIFNWLKKEGVAKKVVNYRLRDWCISRQRYWGTPIPLIDCPKCGFVPVNESDLPVKLPKNAIFGIGNPLLTEKEWLNVKCPKCGSPAQRVADTMDTFVNSSWYFLRFCDPKNNKEIFDKEKIKYWMPVDLYIGGPEHACMHLLFHRFYTMFLHDIGYLDFEEPTPRLFHQGMINDENGVKMSKSKGNVVEPIETMKKYGVDTTRFFLMSEASPDKGFNWSDKGIQGSLRFINKMLSVLENIQFGDDSFEMTNKMNLSIKNITEEIENIDLRKASIELRDLLATIEKQEKISKKTYDNFLKLLTPFCPHICEELWEKSKHSGFISNSSWPVFEIINSKKDKSIIDLNEKTVSLIKSLEEKINTSKNKKVYVYVLPFELGKLDSSLICKNTGFEVKIYSVNDNNKYDPENKAKKAKPGMPSIYWTSDI